MIKFFNKDCIDLMNDYSENHFDLAIVDPPYFSGPEKRKYYGKRISTRNVKRVNYPICKNWEVPTAEYFNQLFRISKNQIIWGCNYYNSIELPPGRIIWDKCNKATTFSDAEIAATSVHDSVRIFKYMWNGMLQGKSIKEGHIAQGNKTLNEKRIHQTQKPVNLYKWLLLNYTKKGDKIIDTHGGSGSSMIACHDLGFDLVWTEIDRIHYDNAVKRLERHRSQLCLDL